MLFNMTYIVYLEIHHKDVAWLNNWYSVNKTEFFFAQISWHVFTVTNLQQKILKFKWKNMLQMWCVGTVNKENLLKMGLEADHELGFLRF